MKFTEWPMRVPVPLLSMEMECFDVELQGRQGDREQGLRMRLKWMRFFQFGRPCERGSSSPLLRMGCETSTIHIHSSTSHIHFLALRPGTCQALLCYAVQYRGIGIPHKSFHTTHPLCLVCCFFFLFFYSPDLAGRNHPTISSHRCGASIT